MRIDLIEKKLADMIDAVNMVKENLPDSLTSFESLGLIKHGLYKQLEYAIESVLDICSIINSDLDLGFPETEDSIFDHLERKKIFDSMSIRVMRDMKKFRNYLVHKYGDIDDKKAYDDIKSGLKDFRIIEKLVREFLQKHKGKSNAKN